METKFIITLLLSFGFLWLYWLTKKRLHALEQAETIEGEIIEIFILNREKPRFGFAIDRGEAFGNFTKIKYKHEGTEKIFDSTLINNSYHIGQKVLLKRVDDQQILICNEINGDKKMTLSFLVVFVVLLSVSAIGIIRKLI
ncbi:MAG: hypothetical protein ACI9D5_000570 [Candidatus Endobugula sp.]